MLDYAANASSYWGIDRILAAFDAHRREQGGDPEADLAAHLGPDADPERFWEDVATNLRAGRLRLVFVADVIPRELRAIVEFLNEQMQRAHVLGIEVKQYRAPDSELVTLVPRVIGQTEAAKEAKGGRSARRSSRAELIDVLSAVAPDAATAAEAILEWAAARPELDIRWTRAGVITIAGQPSSVLMRLWTWEAGMLELSMVQLRRLDPAWEDEHKTEALLRRLEQIRGVSFSGNRRHEPRTPLAPLADPATRKAFLAVIEEVTRALIDSADDAPERPS